MEKNSVIIGAFKETNKQITDREEVGGVWEF